MRSGALKAVRARRLRVPEDLSITCSTRVRVASATSGLSLRMRETVATDTPLATDTSTMVGFFDRVRPANARDSPFCAFTTRR